MQDRFCQEAVDISLQDIRNDERPFGGITVVFGGDFQQILPVVIKGRREEIVGHCLQHSKLWDHVQILHLTENKRLDTASQEDQEFARWLLEVGHGSNSGPDGCVQLPDNM